jgi:hypothetical protein
MHRRMVEKYAVSPAAKRMANTNTRHIFGERTIKFRRTANCNESPHLKPSAQSVRQSTGSQQTAHKAYGKIYLTTN